MSLRNPSPPMFLPNIFPRRRLFSTTPSPSACLEEGDDVDASERRMTTAKCNAVAKFGLYLFFVLSFALFPLSTPKKRPEKPQSLKLNDASFSSDLRRDVFLNEEPPFQKKFIRNSFEFLAEKNRSKCWNLSFR